ncbi:MAG TPA: complex I NDUFA9 subunit family protein [Beijerinckiaceae bacterium]|jgi:NADH dehydrogenase
MTDPAHPLSPQIVTVFGGSGFVGRNVVALLARRNFRIRVAVRRPNLAGNVQPFGFPGQIHPVQANLRYLDSVERAVRGASVVINLVGVLRADRRQTFEGVHAEGARRVAEAAAAAGARLVHVSALGADLASASAYARTKAEGEAAVRAAVPDAVIFRPSVIFGPGDGFLNRFGSLARFLPVMPLAGADTRFQPVYVGDVAAAVARAGGGAVAGGRIYELGGPEVRTLRELVGYVLAVTGRRRFVVPLSPRFARWQAWTTEMLDLVTLGLMPDELVLTRDQVALLSHDNVVSGEAKAEGRTLEALGIAPTSIEAIAPAYLTRFRKTGQFDPKRDADVIGGSATPDDLAPRSAGPGSGFRPGEAAGPAAVGEHAR